jgi:predicted DNA binding protein
VKSVLKRRITRNSVYRILSKDLFKLVLTEHEERVISKARELGYFDVPRRVKLDDLANEFRVTKMGVSLVLRKALRKLVGVI